MAKRFPIPEFDHDSLKGLEWAAPSPIAADEVARLTGAAASEDASAYGAYTMPVDDAVFDALAVRGDHKYAALCLVPSGGVTMMGRSYAWFIQRLFVLDVPPRADAQALLTWKTPRPMNTRLGPEDGVAAPAAALCLVSGHGYSDYWIGNRMLVDTQWQPASGNGFRVMWCDGDERNDFHSVVVSFSW